MTASGRGRGPDRDAGFATVAVAALLLLVVTATVLVVGGSAAVTARHEAQLAADLAALAGAGRLGIDDAAACAEAGRIAAVNGAHVRSCTAVSTGLRTGEVRVEITRPGRWAGFVLDATARARAARIAAAGVGRGPPDVGDRTRPTALGASARCVWQHDRAAGRAFARRNRTASPGAPP